MFLGLNMTNLKQGPLWVKGAPLTHNGEGSATRATPSNVAMAQPGPASPQSEARPTGSRARSGSDGPGGRGARGAGSRAGPKGASPQGRRGRAWIRPGSTEGRSPFDGGTGVSPVTPSLSVVFARPLGQASAARPRAAGRVCPRCRRRGGGARRTAGSPVLPSVA